MTRKKNDEEEACVAALILVCVQGFCEAATSFMSLMGGNQSGARKMGDSYCGFCSTSFSFLCFVSFFVPLVFWVKTVSSLL